MQKFEFVSYISKHDVTVAEIAIGGQVVGAPLDVHIGRGCPFVGGVKVRVQLEETFIKLFYVIRKYQGLLYHRTCKPDSCAVGRR